MFNNTPQSPALRGQGTAIRTNSAEGRFQGDYNLNAGALNGQYAFSNTQTALPYVVASNSTGSVGGNTIGFPYASFLLGLVNTANSKPPSAGRRKTSIGVLCPGQLEGGAQTDAGYRITIRLLDISQRAVWTHAESRFQRANPSAGGIRAVQYEATCKCNFAKNYPWAFGPRMGVAYRFMDKAVLAPVSASCTQERPNTICRVERRRPAIRLVSA